VLTYETPPAVDAQPDDGLWHAGSLTYTNRGLAALFLCLLGGDFFWQFRERAISPAIPLLLRHFGASDFATAVLMGFVPPALAIFLSPVVSYRSDRYRSRFGRRIPFLLIATPPAFVAMMGLALSPVIGRWIHSALGLGPASVTACVIGTFSFFWILFDVAVIVTNSVHGALVNDVVPREVLGRFFGLFRVASLGAGMLFNFFLLGEMQGHYVAIFWAIGLLYLVCFTVMCLLVKEGPYPPPPPPIEGGALMRLAGAIAGYCRECFTKPYYLWFFLSFLLAHMAFAPINLFSLFFAQSVGMSMATYGKFSALQLGLSLVQAPILGWVADKIHPLRLTIVALFLYAVSTGIAFVFVRDARTFAAAHVICGTCSGFWLTATAPLAPALLPKMKFATFASVLVIASSIAGIVTAPIIGAIVEYLNRGKPAAARDYHVMYLWACGFITLSLVVTLVVHRHFMAYGGRRAYVAPE
jgi:MFS family permease